LYSFFNTEQNIKIIDEKIIIRSGKKDPEINDIGKRYNILLIVDIENEYIY
tara:strand:- start:100 stop:252 length:153 start_codon:yes stop_codon:yes gene_type:complete